MIAKILLKNYKKMEKYINDNTIVKNDLYSVFQDLISCPICSNILINPLMCMNCQNVYCKKCIDEWSKKDNKCPNRCENPNFKKSIEKNNILSKLKFKCNKCEKEILYDDVQKHADKCDPNNEQDTQEKKIEEKNVIQDYFSNNFEEKVKVLTPGEALKERQKGNDTMNITCKKL